MGQDVLEFRQKDASKARRRFTARPRDCELGCVSMDLKAPNLAIVSARK